MKHLTRKIGYGLGDMSSSMFWKIFSYYLPIFYSDIFSLSLGATATLMLVTRIWDTISDPMMGIIADRTHTRWGTYRPYILWMALPFAVMGILLFTTPSLSETGRLVYAYVTYILMMTVYTAINVPYGSMLAVVTDNSDEKTVYSSFRMFFAYAGSFVALFAWEPLCHFFEQHTSTSTAWQLAMVVIGLVCFILFLLCFTMTREQVPTEHNSSIGNDFKHLLSNTPWWLLTIAAMCSNLFNTVRGATVAYYFKYYIGENVHIYLGGTWSFLFFAGLFLAIGEVCNMVGVLLATPLSMRVGKKPTFVIASLVLAILSCWFFFVPITNGGLLTMLGLQIAISITTGVISPLIWSMYADVAHYSQTTYGTASTGLIFSSGSMAQKFGGAVAGSAVLWLFDAFGLVPNAPTQTAQAILGMQLTMSFIPAAIAILMMGIVLCYPLSRKRMLAIDAKHCLNHNILPYWLKLRDHEKGGFYGQVNGEETVVPTAERGAVLYARLLWTFAACEMKEEADEVKNYILNHFIDHQNGGVYWSVDYQGQPIDTKKQYYAHAFMLYAFSEYARVMHDDEALKTAIQFYRWIEQYAADHVHGGYMEAADRQWQPISDMRLSDKDENACKSQNTHLHILEAYTNLYKIWPTAELKNAITHLIHVFEQHIILPNGHLGLFFNAQWEVTSNAFSYGHDIECSWLLYEASRIIDVSANEAVLRLSNQPFPQTNLTMDWWEPAEAVVGYLNRYQHFHDHHALRNMQNAWTYINTYLIDNQHGEWYWSAQHRIGDDKAGFWKCPYHNARMCLEIMKRCNN